MPFFLLTPVPTLALNPNNQMYGHESSAARPGDRRRQHVRFASSGVLRLKRGADDYATALMLIAPCERVGDCLARSCCWTEPQPARP
jgi:hypothetical protein